MKNIYKLTVYNSIIRESDNTYIPIDLDNSDYQVYLSWVEEGNTADPIPAPTIEEQQALNIVAIQFYMDNKAKSRGYFDIKSACAYASTISIVASNDPNYSLCEKFRLEGNALQTWMAITWATAYKYLDTVLSGENPMPTIEQAVAMVPVFTWPN